MGKDKATILFWGKPLWQIQIELLRSLKLVEIFVSAREKPNWHPTTVQFVRDTPLSRGPLSGLSAAMREMRGSHLLVLAVDMPFMNAGHLRKLSRQIGPGRGVLPMIANRAEPLAAIYPLEARVEVDAALSGTDFSLQSLTNQLRKLGKLETITLTKEEALFYRNLNEPIDVVSLKHFPAF
jgi:molybdopterin-guanine dinucleotide biosynthesis protein A